MREMSIDMTRKEAQQRFAYTLRAELNNDGSYSVTMFDVECDESWTETVIKRAKITIEVLEDGCGESDEPLLYVIG